MTFCFIQAIERGHGATYGTILTAMRNAIREAGSSGGDSGGGAVTSLITMLLTGGSVGGGLRQVFYTFFLTSNLILFLSFRFYIYWCISDDTSIFTTCLTSHKIAIDRTKVRSS